MNNIDLSYFPHQYEFDLTEYQFNYENPFVINCPNQVKHIKTGINFKFGDAEQIHNVEKITLVVENTSTQAYYLVSFIEKNYKLANEFEVNIVNFESFLYASENVCILIPDEVKNMLVQSLKNIPRNFKLTICGKEESLDIPRYNPPNKSAMH